MTKEEIDEWRKMKPVTIEVSQETYDVIVDMLAHPPEPNEKLKALFKKHRRLDDAPMVR